MTVLEGTDPVSTVTQLGERTSIGCVTNRNGIIFPLSVQELTRDAVSGVVVGNRARLSRGVETMSEVRSGEQ
jgi:hypothetical protein